MRRRHVFVVAVIAALSVATPVGAYATDRSDDQSAAGCPPPVVVSDYDIGRLAVAAHLEASGCPTREHRQYPFSVSITRTDPTGGEDGMDSFVICGPFAASSDMEPDMPARRYSCDVDGALDHPPIEAARYRIDVAYPDGNGDTTITSELFCVSDGTTGHCDPADDTDPASGQQLPTANSRPAATTGQ